MNDSPGRAQLPSNTLLFLPVERDSREREGGGRHRRIGHEMVDRAQSGAEKPVPKLKNSIQFGLLHPFLYSHGPFCFNTRRKKGPFTAVALSGLLASGALRGIIEEESGLMLKHLRAAFSSLGLHEAEAEDGVEDGVEQVCHA